MITVTEGLRKLFDFTFRATQLDEIFQSVNLARIGSPDYT